MRFDFYSHIPLSPNYVERADLLSNLRDALLGDQPSIVLTSDIKSSATALYGMGGIGKSILARAMCDDPAIQKRFADGILWLTLGQIPNIITRQRDWIIALGGTVTQNAPTLEDLKTQLFELLKMRACLLIIDDVWQVEHAEAFKVGGEQCRDCISTSCTVATCSSHDTDTIYSTTGGMGKPYP